MSPRPDPLRHWRIVPTAPEHAETLAALQRQVFPTLAPRQRFEAAHYRRHVAMFPEGQFAAVAGEMPGIPVASTTTLRLDLDPDAPRHSFAEIMGGGFLTAHDPEGAWLYGADLGVHPDFRRRGIARALYAARHRLVRERGLLGQVTVGLLSGYGSMSEEVPARTYFHQVVTGVRTDPTLSVQLRLGFEPRAILSGYVDDPVCRGYGVFLVLPADRPVLAPSPPAASPPGSSPAPRPPGSAPAPRPPGSSPAPRPPGSYPGARPRGSSPAPPPSGSSPAPRPSGSSPAPRPRGSYPGARPRGSSPAPPPPDSDSAPPPSGSSPAPRPPDSDPVPPPSGSSPAPRPPDSDSAPRPPDSDPAPRSSDSDPAPGPPDSRS